MALERSNLFGDLSGAFISESRHNAALSFCFSPAADSHKGAGQIQEFTDTKRG